MINGYIVIIITTINHRSEDGNPSGEIRQVVDFKTVN